MGNLETRVVQHPSIGDVRYAVPDGDVSRWEAQGWTVSDASPQPAVQVDEPVLTVAQETGFGLGVAAADPDAQQETQPPAPAEAPTAADVQVEPQEPAAAGVEQPASPAPTAPAVAEQPAPEPADGST